MKINPLYRWRFSSVSVFCLLFFLSSFSVHATYYAVQQITSGTEYGNDPMINDSGQVVWYMSDGDDYEIYLYSNGSITKITDNDYWDQFPSINNNGQIAWYGQTGWWNYGIYLYINGNTSKIGQSDPTDISPQINNNGQVVWTGQTSAIAEDIYYYSNGQAINLTNNSIDSLALVNGVPQINHNGEVA